MGQKGHSPYFPHSPNGTSQSCQPVLHMQLLYHPCASVSPLASQSGACIPGALFVGSDSPGLFLGLMVTWEGPCPSLPAGSSRAGGASAGMWGWEGRAWWGHRDSLAPRQWDGVGRSRTDTAMELLWVLLALAGMDVAAGLGEGL